MCKQFNSFSKTPDLLATLTTSQGSSDQALIESTADSVFMDSLIDASVFADSSIRDGKLNFGQLPLYSWYLVPTTGAAQTTPTVRARRNTITRQWSWYLLVTLARIIRGGLFSHWGKWSPEIPLEGNRPCERKSGTGYWNRRHGSLYRMYV